MVLCIPIYVDVYHYLRTMNPHETVYNRVDRHSKPVSMESKLETRTGTPSIGLTPPPVLEILHSLTSTLIFAKKFYVIFITYLIYRFK